MLAVPRRKDAFQRKILACVPAGLLIKRIKDMFPQDPQMTELGMYGGTSLGIIEADDGRLRYAGSDETQAFTSVEMPAGHAELQAGPLVAVSATPEHQRRSEWSLSKRVRPCYQRMAMGRSDSVFLLMCIHLRVAQEARRRWHRLRDFTILNLLGVRLAGCRVKGSRGAIYIHVDDVLAAHSNQEDADFAIRMIVMLLKEMGFVVKAELNGECRKFVGYIREKNRTELQVQHERLGDVSRALQMLSEQNWIPIGALHTVTSIFIWISLLWRPLMALGFRVHKFIAKNEESALVWNPPEVGKELWLMSWFISFAKACLKAPNLPLLFAQDAAGGSKVVDGTDKVSFALAVGVPPSSMLEQLRGRQVTDGRERRRYAKELEVGTAFDDAVPWTEVPRGLFGKEVPWYMLWGGIFRWPLHINRGELKPAIYWLRILGGIGDCSDLWMLDILDNSAATGALRHGRSPAWGMNADLRERCVVEGITGLRLGPSWTSTACQPADVDTRISDGNARPQLRRLELGRRILLLVAIGDSIDLHEKKIDAPLVELRWDTRRGKKFDPLHVVGVDHFWGLLCCS